MCSTRVIAAFIVFFALVPSIAMAGDDSPPTPYVDFAFDASRGGSIIDQIFRIREYRAYYFELQFDYEGDDGLYRVLKLVGGGSRYPDGRYADPGVVVPIHLRVSRSDVEGKVDPIFNETVEVVGHSSHGFSRENQKNGNYRRRIATVRLKPGLYRVQANTVVDRPEFAGVESHFAIGFHPKVLPLTE